MRPDGQTAGGGAAQDSALLAARVLLAAMLMIAAFNKFKAYAVIVPYFGKLGLPMPEIMLPLVLTFEVLAGIALIVGFQTRLVGLAVGIFCIAAGLIAHNNIADINQFNHLLKNIGLLGAGLALWVAGGGRYAMDARGS